MLNIPSAFDPNQLPEFIASCQIPQSINIEQIDSITTDVKAVKALKTQIVAEKKRAQEPFEKERAKHSTLFEKAKMDKKNAGAPYEELESWVKTTESTLRRLIDGALAEQLRQQQAAEAERARVAYEAEQQRLRAEAQAAEARRSGEVAAQIEAVRQEQLAKQAEHELQASKFAAEHVQEQAAPSSIKQSKILDYKVTNIDEVPDEYIDYVPNMQAIYGLIQGHFSYVVEMSIKVDIDKVPDDLVYGEPNDARIIADLRKDVVIPGIEKTYTTRTSLK